MLHITSVQEMLKAGKIYTNQLIINCQKKTLNLGKYLTAEV